MRGQIIGDQHATGFFYRHGARIFLVSARHAIAGVDTFTGSVCSSRGYLPRQIRFYLTEEHDGQVLRIPTILTVRAEDDAPLWMEDPEYEELRTDIVCLEIPTHHPERVPCVNQEPDADLLSVVGFDCFVIGYPNRNYITPYLPVWRRASLAYEPTMPIDDKPIFLLDGLTSGGMSGAPIMQVWHGPAPIGEVGGEIEIKLDAVVTQRFVGVYGGRLHHKLEMGQIGYGWYANRVPMILDGKSPKPLTETKIVVGKEVTLSAPILSL